MISDSAMITLNEIINVREVGFAMGVTLRDSCSLKELQSESQAISAH